MDLNLTTCVYGNYVYKQMFILICLVLVFLFFIDLICTYYYILLFGEILRCLYLYNKILDAGSNIY